MKKYFYELSDYAVAEHKADEVLQLNYNGEITEFCRFNNAAVRQSGVVEQAGVELTLINGKRQASCSLRLNLSLNLDKKSIDDALAQLRERLSVLPEDEFISYSQEVNNSEDERQSELSGSEIVGDILQRTEGLDFVGVLACGNIYRAFANSLGQRNYFACTNFNVDFSIYHSTDKAVKGGFAGTEWELATFENELQRCLSEIELMKSEAISLEPGEYDVFLAPAALDEFVQMLNWGGFSSQAHQLKSSALHRFGTGEVHLSEKVSLCENIADGFSPAFQSGGFIKPDSLSLIEKGVYKNHLVNPRSALEYNLECNGADESEVLSSGEMAAGDIEFSKACQQLGTGIYINNLWYLNYSDKNNCRITGMTRFCCYYVENGQAVAPINVLRFDDSIYEILGGKLEGFTKERQLIMDAGTYYERSTRSARLPGALIRGMKFTL